MTYIFDLMFYLSVCGFCLNYFYYLKNLLMMEFIVLSVMVVLLGTVYAFSHYIIYILILSVCEGILGLLVLVLMYRFWGSDRFSLIDFDL